MRFFWIAIGVLILSSALVVSLRAGGKGGSRSADGTGPANVGADSARAIEQPPRAPEPAPVKTEAQSAPTTASTEPKPETAPPIEPKPETPKAAPEVRAPAEAPAEPVPAKPTLTMPAEAKLEVSPAVESKVADKPSGESAAADRPVDAKPAETKPADPLAELSKLAAAPEPAKAEGEEAKPEGGKTVEFTFPDDPAFPMEKLVPSKAVKREDGTLVMDGRFSVKGAGTKENPYRITWEHLVSAQEVYKPRLGQKRLPQRVAFLNNKYVRIEGYVAFPLASNNPRECLVMLNQWDGCCIGVPPTAYDAVEVKLAKPATGDQRLVFHGKLEGKFKVDPYEEGGWLIGLYLMDDATLKGDQ